MTVCRRTKLDLRSSLTRGQALLKKLNNLVFIYSYNFQIRWKIPMNTSNSPTGSNTSTAETKFLEIPIVQFVILLSSLALTFWYLSFFGVDFNKIKALEPNALGDFLAGTFAPLGFILLILGYMLNTSALKIQAQELRNSVQEQQALVETAKMSMIC